MLLLQMVSITIYVDLSMNVHYILMFTTTVELNEMGRLLYPLLLLYCC